MILHIKDAISLKYVNRIIININVAYQYYYY